MPDANLETTVRLREDLTAAFRLCHRFGWSESVGNHFSAAVSDDGRFFLLNPRWRHFASIRPSDLLLLDAEDATVMERPDAPDPSAWAIHGTMHRELPEARVILHCHAPFATALACLKVPTVLPIDNNTARFFGRVGYDLAFGGISDSASEGRRLARAMRGKTVLVMGNHGVSVAGLSVAAAFEDLYFFEKAAQTLVLALSTGKPLSVLADSVASATSEGWGAYRGMADCHFDHLKSELDVSTPGWRS
ncbi:MAG: class II aldolase/adducin family protein [Alphaproteobacteria bacterium]|nr:class II aldolase/adducin family protein [Alphaproteobacteria bacterium]